MNYKMHWCPYCLDYTMEVDKIIIDDEAHNIIQLFCPHCRAVSYAHYDKTYTGISTIPGAIK